MTMHEYTSLSRAHANLHHANDISCSARASLMSVMQMPLDDPELDLVVRTLSEVSRKLLSCAEAIEARLSSDGRDTERCAS